MRRVVILHTNDLHNHLKAPAAERIRSLKEAEHNVLLLDAGDAISAGNIYFRPGGEPILELMSSAGYDAMVMGNREFHFLQIGLKAKLASASFSILSANLRGAKSDIDLPVKSHIIKELDNGVRVGIIGLSVPMITEKMLSRKVSSYVFDDPVEAAERLVPRLAGQVDLLVALTHIGLKNDRRLAEAVPDIDLIVGGHSHDVLEQPEKVGWTDIVQAGWFAQHIGRVEVQLDAPEPPAISASVVSLRE